MHHFWEKHIKPENWSKFFSLGQYAWLDWNLASADIGLVPWNWSALFGIAIWAIWKDRNSLVFSNSSCMGEELWSLVCNHTHFYEYVSVNSKSSTDLNQGSSSATWIKPHQGVFKLNVDGSHSIKGNNFACGGSIRIDSGEFLRGFFSKVTSSNVVWAEMWGVYSGLKLAREMRLLRVLVETYSRTVVDIIKNSFSVNPALNSLLKDIQLLMRNKD